MALAKGDGTLLSQTPGGTVLESQAETDPKIKVLIDVYKDTPYDGVDYPTQMKQLAYRAGQIIPQSEWDAQFVDPTITSVSPATGAAAGGTVVTVVGSGFTTGATVAVGGTAGTSVSVKNDKKLTYVSPAKAAGTYSVTVTTAAGVATKTTAFTTS
jgi:hypothetical protein